MVKNNQKIEIEPSKELFGKIIIKIKKEKRLASAKKRIFIFSAGFLGSLIAFIPSCQMVKAEFMQSGFLQFFFLIFSDLSVVAVYWKSFAFTLIESLPIVSLIIFFSVLFILFESARYLAKNVRAVLVFN